MKKLFLASVARNILSMFVESLDRPTSKFKVAFIPTAGNVIKENEFILEDRKKLVDLGFNLVDINLENKKKSQLLEEMNGVDVIFVAGGNTFYLLQEVLKSKFNEIVESFVERGGIYIGSSAGTLLAGPSIELAKNIDNLEDAPDLKSCTGLGLVDFVILPHYDDEEFKKKIDENLKKYKCNYKVIKITDNQAVWVDGDDYKIISSAPITNNFKNNN